MTGRLVAAEARVKDGEKPVLGIGGSIGEACWRSGTSVDLTSLSYGLDEVR